MLLIYRFIGPLTLVRGDEYIQIGVVSFGLGRGCELSKIIFWSM